MNAAVALGIGDRRGDRWSGRMRLKKLTKRSLGPVGEVERLVVFHLPIEGRVEMRGVEICA